MNALKQPLVFGNQAQIDALRSIRSEVERRERLNEYEVVVHVEGYATVIVEEESEEEATEFALEIIGDNIAAINISDTDFSVDSVLKIGKKDDDDECQSTLC